MGDKHRLSRPLTSNDLSEILAMVQNHRDLPMHLRWAILALVMEVRDCWWLIEVLEGRRVREASD